MLREPRELDAGPRLVGEPGDRRIEQRLCLVRRHAVRDVQDALGRLAIEARGSGFGLAIQQEPQLSGVQAF